MRLETVLDFILQTVRSHGKFLNDKICNKENSQKYFSQVIFIKGKSYESLFCLKSVGDYSVPIGDVQILYFGTQSYNALVLLTPFQAHLHIHLCTGTDLAVLTNCVSHNLPCFLILSYLCKSFLFCSVSYNHCSVQVSSGTYLLTYFLLLKHPILIKRMGFQIQTII